MTNDTQRYLDALTAFTDVVHDVPADRWDAASPCPGWSAADVVDHLIDTQRDFLTGHGIEVGERPTGDPITVWDRHLSLAWAVAQDAETMRTPIDGAFGPTTLGATLARFYGFDAVVHRWDLARAVGLDAPFRTQEMDELETAIDGFGEHLYADGVCAPAVPTPADASRSDRILGLLGRRAALVA